MLSQLCSFNPYRREEEREQEEEETRPTPPATPTRPAGTSTGAATKPLHHKWAKAEDKILLFDLLEELDPEGVSVFR